MNIFAAWLFLRKWNVRHTFCNTWVMLVCLNTVRIIIFGVNFPNIFKFSQYYRAIQLCECAYNAASTILCTCSLLYTCTKIFSDHKHPTKAVKTMTHTVDLCALIYFYIHFFDNIIIKTCYCIPWYHKNEYSKL